MASDLAFYRWAILGSNYCLAGVAIMAPTCEDAF